MNWRAMLFLLLCLLLTSCDEDSKKKKVSLPPTYALGDVVKISQSSQVGFITEVNGSFSSWSYKVQFKNTEMRYNEENLVLVERFNWDKYAKAEVDVNDLKEKK